MHIAAHFVSSIVGQVTVPAPDGAFPGNELVTKLVGYGRYLTLILSVGAIFYGGGSWAWSRWGNAGAAASGRTWVLGGIAGALLAGLAPAIVNQLFSSAGG